MVKTTTITFNVPEELKETFDSKTKSNAMNISYALRQLMERYIEDDSILTHSPKDILLLIDERLNRLQETQTVELEKRLNQWDTIIANARDYFGSFANKKEKTLTQEIVDLLSKDSRSRGVTYEKTEILLLKSYSHLKSQIHAAKLRGEDPVGDAIGFVRDQGLASYSNATKRLKWVVK